MSVLAKKSTSEPRLSDREKILEALRTRSLPETSECHVGEIGWGWECQWPIDNPYPFWGLGETPAEAHSAMIEKIEHALRQARRPDPKEKGESWTARERAILGEDPSL